MQPQTHTVRAWFQHRNDALIAYFGAQALEGCLDGGGVMGEVIVYGNTPGHPDGLQPALHVLEPGKSRAAHIDGNTGVM